MYVYLVVSELAVHGQVNSQSMDTIPHISWTLHYVHFTIQMHVYLAIKIYVYLVRDVIRRQQLVKLANNMLN